MAKTQNNIIESFVLQSVILPCHMKRTTHAHFLRLIDLADFWYIAELRQAVNHPVSEYILCYFIVICYYCSYANFHFHCKALLSGRTSAEIKFTFLYLSAFIPLHTSLSPSIRLVFTSRPDSERSLNSLDCNLGWQPTEREIPRTVMPSGSI